jgi:hypothetical protein
MRIMNARLIAGPALALAAAATISACGGSAPAAAPTLAKEFPAMKAAARSASSVRLVGALNSNTLDMVLTRSGDLNGTSGHDGVEFTVLVVGGTSYIKVTSEFLRLAKAPAAACAKYCGKWVEAPPSTTSALTSGLSMSQLVDGIFAKVPTKAEGGKPLKATVFHSQPAWSAQHQGTTVYIARHGKPYLLGYTHAGQGLRFTDWNTATVPGKPAPSQIVQISQLVHP